MVDRGSASLSRFLTDGIIGNLVGNTPPTMSVQRPVPFSLGFETFIRTVNRSKTKHEEASTVKRELENVQNNISQPNVSLVQMKDYLCRLVYCNMLGYDVSFGCIHAVKLAQQGSQIDKKLGYMVCGLLLHREHELILLLINTIHKDLKSSNILDNMAALSAASQLLSAALIPTILPLVLEKLKHSRELVRQKAVMCLYQFQLLAPDLLDHHQDYLKMVLFDKDPGVMSIAVHIVYNNIQRDPIKHKDIGMSLLKILKQIILHKMTTMFDYHTVPFPWLQIQIIRCLTKLSVVNDELKKELPEVMKDIFDRTAIKENIAFAILHECILCVIAVKTSVHLLDEAAQHVGKFIRSADPNLKYLGMKSLLSIVEINPVYAHEYQELITESLETADFNVLKKIHRLLHHIANKTNVNVVCAKLLEQLQASTDQLWKCDIVEMVIDLIQRFTDDPHWQIDIMFSCLQYGHDVIDGKVINNMLSIIERGFEPIQHIQQKSHQYLVQKCVATLVCNTCSSVAVHVAAWVLGELGLMLKNMPADRVVSIFTRHLHNIDQPYSVHSSLVTALQKLVIKHVVTYDSVIEKLQECLHLQLSIVIKQRLSVLLEICKLGLPLHKQDSIKSMDLTLSFLDDYVSEYLEAGGEPFVPVHLRGHTAVAKETQDLFNTLLVSEDTEIMSRKSSISSTKTAEESETSIKLPVVKRVWGKQGRLDTMHDQSNMTEIPKLSHENEQNRKRKELASSLFAGLEPSTQAKEITAEYDNSDLNVGVSDSAGWRSFHSSMEQQKSQLSSEKSLPNEDILLDKSNSHTNQIVDTHELNDVELPNLNEQYWTCTVNQDMDTFKRSSYHSKEQQLQDSFLLSANDSLNSYNAASESNDKADNVKEIPDIIEIDNKNFDQALSALLENDTHFINASALSSDHGVLKEGNKQSFQNLCGTSYDLNGTLSASNFQSYVSHDVKFVSNEFVDTVGELETEENVAFVNDGNNCLNDQVKSIYSEEISSGHPVL